MCELNSVLPSSHWGVESGNTLQPALIQLSCDLNMACCDAPLSHYIGWLRWSTLVVCVRCAHTTMNAWVNSLWIWVGEREFNEVRTERFAPTGQLDIYQHCTDWKCKQTIRSFCCSCSYSPVVFHSFFHASLNNSARTTHGISDLTEVNLHLPQWDYLIAHSLPSFTA